MRLLAHHPLTNDLLLDVERTAEGELVEHHVAPELAEAWGGWRRRGLNERHQNTWWRCGPRDPRLLEHVGGYLRDWWGLRVS